MIDRINSELAYLQEKFTYDDKKCVDKKKGCTEKNYWTGHIEITVDK